jgi:hypothetical protein
MATIIGGLGPTSELGLGSPLVLALVVVLVIVIALGSPLGGTKVDDLYRASGVYILRLASLLA